MSLQSRATQLAGGGHDQRIDLDQLGVAYAIGVVKFQEELDQRLLFLLEAEHAEDVLQELVVDTVPDVHRQMRHLVRMFGGDFLDVHAAFGREQEEAGFWVSW